MSELTFTVLRLGYLLVLWLLVFGAAMVIRRDIYGTLIAKRGPKTITRKANMRREIETSKGSAPTTLVVTAGPLTGSVLQLLGPIMIGRSPDSTLVLEDGYASAQHARIFFDADTWWVEDLNSTNGTIVGGSRISVPTPLTPGLAVQIGTTSLELRK